MNILRALKDAMHLRSRYRAVFGTPDGQAVLLDLMKAGQVTTSAFTAANPHQTAYDNGARDLVLGILKKINRTDEDLKKQIEEVYKQENQPNYE